MRNQNKDPGPIRTCLGCGKKQQKSLLHRLVLTETHQPMHDRTQTAPGRGAYVCGSGCLSAAIRRKALNRAWKKQHPLVDIGQTNVLEANLLTKF